MPLDELLVPTELDDVQRALLCDPQTSGGLLVACADTVVERVLAIFARHRFLHAAVIGDMREGAPGVTVTP